jgi:hypothetical protein
MKICTFCYRERKKIVDITNDVVAEGSFLAAAHLDACPTCAMNIDAALAVFNQLLELAGPVALKQALTEMIPRPSAGPPPGQ